MLMRLVVLVAVVGLGAVLAAPANAAPKPKTRSFTVSFQAAPLQNVPNTAVGLATSTLGKGPIVIVGGATGTVVSYNAKGSLRGTFSITTMTNPDMSATYTGTTTITGGTGAYAGAKGKGTIGGTISADGLTITGEGSGKVTY
jgi:hypothetical protein